MANPAEVPRWRPKEFRLLPPPEVPAEAPTEAVPADLVEASNIMNLLGGAAIGTVGFLVATHQCLSGNQQARREAGAEIGLAIGLASSIAWGVITGNTWAGVAGAAGTMAAYGICKFA